MTGLFVRGESEEGSHQWSISRIVDRKRDGRAWIKSLHSVSFPDTVLNVSSCGHGRSMVRIALPVEARKAFDGVFASTARSNGASLKQLIRYSLVPKTEEAEEVAANVKEYRSQVFPVMR